MNVQGKDEKNEQHRVRAIKAKGRRIKPTNSKINQRTRKCCKEIGKAKEAQGVNRFDPVRERTMLNNIIENNDGPFENSTIQHIFKEIFKAGLELQEEDHSKALLVSRKKNLKIQL